MLKMNKRKGLGIFILVLALGMTACGAHHRHHDMDQAKMMKRITKSLDLNETQQGKLKVLLEDASAFRQSMESNHVELSSSLNENLSAPQMDIASLNMQFDEIESEFSGFRKAMISDFADFHNSLDTSQREKLAAKLEKMNKHMHH